MDLPFHVYTARNGYAWLGADPTNRILLDQFLKAIGRMPDFDLGETARRGVLNVRDHVVIYRFMLQQKADSKGRDAVYLALTYLPASQSANLDIDHLFQTAPFTEPRTTSPANVHYLGPPSALSKFSVPSIASSGTFDSTGSLASCGALFSNTPEGRLHISVEETTPPGPAQFRYSLDAPKPITNLPVVSPPEQSVATPILTVAPNYKRQNLLLAILLGILIMWAALQLKNIWLQKMESQEPQTHTAPANLNEISAGPDQEPNPETARSIIDGAHTEKFPTIKIDSTPQISENPHHE